MNTYCYGPNFKVKRVITKHEFIMAIKRINERFTGGHFQPEPRGEGAIEFIFDGNNEWYKSLRFFANQGYTTIHGDELDTWVNNEDI
jgi:hypothetical protein